MDVCYRTHISHPFNQAHASAADKENETQATTEHCSALTEISAAACVTVGTSTLYVRSTIHDLRGAAISVLDKETDYRRNPR